MKKLYYGRFLQAGAIHISSKKGSIIFSKNFWQCSEIPFRFPAAAYFFRNL